MRKINPHVTGKERTHILYNRKHAIAILEYTDFSEKSNNYRRVSNLILVSIHLLFIEGIGRYMKNNIRYDYFAS